MNPRFGPLSRPVAAVILALLFCTFHSCAPETGAEVRPSALAGRWYPESPAVVAVEVDRMVRAASGAPSLKTKPVALVVPHAGWRYSGVAAAAAYRNLHPGDFRRVVVVAPSHRGDFEGFSVPGVEAYATPLGEVPLDTDVLARLKDGKLVQERPGVHDREHAVEIQLPFLQSRLQRFRLVPILAGRTDAEMQRALADRLAGLHDGKTLFVFSTDFTHYGPRFGFSPFGPSAPAVKKKIRELDLRAAATFAPPDGDAFRSYLEETSATICGRHGLGVLLELVPRIAPEASAVTLAYWLSIEMPGFSDDNSVSYLAMAYVEGERPPGDPLALPPEYSACPQDTAALSEETGQALVALARAALRTEMEGTDDLPKALYAFGDRRPEFECLQGVFVTLNRTDPGEIEREGKLRGCIGQIGPVYPLQEAVTVAAVQAALYDRRFRPVGVEELPRLSVEVSVLTPSRPVGSWREIVIGRHGIILRKGERRAVYLPHVATEQGWNLEETLSRLSGKAGLGPDAWKEGASFEVFETQIFEEHPPRSGDKHGQGT